MGWLDDIFNALGSAGTDVWDALFGGGTAPWPTGPGGYPVPYYDPNNPSSMYPVGPGGAAIPFSSFNPNAYTTAMPSAAPGFSMGGGLLGSLGAFINPANPLGGLLTAGATGLSAYDTLQMQQRLNKIAQMAQNPAYYQKFMQALSPQLVNAVSGSVKSQAADMGLGTSPGMMNTLITQALAPYALDEQQLGISEAQTGLSAAAEKARQTDPFMEFLKSL